jgi:hypothetical protein
MFTDEHRRNVWDQIRQRDITQFSAILTPEVFASAAEHLRERLGAGALNLANLGWLAISAALRPGMCFATVLTLTLRLLSDMDRLRPPSRGKAKRPRRRRRSRHDPRTDDPTQLSEEAFVQARQAMPPLYFHALLWVLGKLFAARHDGLTRWNGLRLLALDGTLITLPRRKPLADHFGVARNQHTRGGGGSGGSGGRPQARLVMLHLPLVRLPWRYRITPRASGESTAATQLLQDGVGAGDLVLMDRGFFHFGLFGQIQQARAFFAIRRVKRLRLRTERRLGTDDRLVTWRPAARRWRGAGLRLRMIGYQIKGFRKTAIVTNLLDPARVSRAQLVGLSDSAAWRSERDAGLYHRRWEIETSFGEMKVEMKMESGLRGRTPRTIEYELGGHVLLYTLVRWTMVEAATAHDLRPPPLRLSFKNALEEIRYAATLLPLCTPRQQEQLLARTLERIAAKVVPYRPGRHFPRPNDGKKRFTGSGYRVPAARLARVKA